MLVPRFTISRMLALVTALSVFFAIVAVAARGNYVARAVVTAVLMVGLSLIVFSLVHSLAVIVARITNAIFPPPKRTSPFAEDVTPPRYVSPENE